MFFSLFRKLQKKDTSSTKCLSDSATSQVHTKFILDEKKKFLLHYLKNRELNWKIDEPVKNLFRNCAETIEELKKHGYLRDDDHSYFLETMNMTELKDILRSLKLPLSGKKAELINRIRDNTSIANFY